MRRIDENHKLIVNGLRAAGCHVTSLADLGHGCPDVLVSFRNQWYVAEIKDGAKAPSRRKLTPDEITWHKSAQAPVFIWTNLTDALKTIGALTDK